VNKAYLKSQRRLVAGIPWIRMWPVRVYVSGRYPYIALAFVLQDFASRCAAWPRKARSRLADMRQVEFCREPFDRFARVNFLHVSSQTRANP
jgi:hypothetical protein